MADQNDSEIDEAVAAAGTEDADGVIQPSVDEILDPDPEGLDDDADEPADDAPEA